VRPECLIVLPLVCGQVLAEPGGFLPAVEAEERQGVAGDLLVEVLQQGQRHSLRDIVLTLAGHDTQ
jgi:hypothetical protein